MGIFRRKLGLGRFRLIEMGGWLVWLFGLPALVATPSGAQEPLPLPETVGDLFQQLLEVGLPAPVPGQPPLRLVPPSVAADQSDGQRHAALAKLAGAGGWERFAKPTAVAPVTVAIRPLATAAGERYGYELHTAFVLHTSLIRLGDQPSLERIFGPMAEESAEAGDRLRELDAAELTAAGWESSLPENQRLAYIEVRLLQRIELRGTVRVERRQLEKQIDLAWRFDERFSSLDLPFANLWMKLSDNELGERVAGLPQPYRGGGGYLRLVELPLSPSQVVVESRWLFFEPQAWFDGGNLLRAKLPLLIQESVRSLRRKLD
jgi:hypothetical protein